MTKPTRASVVTNRLGTDRCSVYFDAPNALPYYAAQGSMLAMDFEAEPGAGVAFIQCYFPGIEVEEINAQTGKITKWSP